MIRRRRNRFALALCLCIASPPTLRTWSLLDHQAGQSAEPPPAPVLTLRGDAAVITILIKPDRASDFELVLSKLKQALQNSANTERRTQAAGWTVFKASEPVQGNVAYVMLCAPVVRGQEYDITRLIAEVFPVEVQELFQKYKDAFVGRGITELTSVMSMAQ
jgi:hypothetical protein